jgi:hypothetical protein
MALLDLCLIADFVSKPLVFGRTRLVSAGGLVPASVVTLGAGFGRNTRGRHRVTLGATGEVAEPFLPTRPVAEAPDEDLDEFTCPVGLFYAP